MTDAEDLYHRIAAGLPDAKEGKMFGALCIKAPNGKAGVMFWKGDMVFKLEGASLQEVLALDGAEIFTPAEGRPMGGWVRVPYRHAGRWPELAAESMELVAKLKK
jgi:hypothetical protein